MEGLETVKSLVRKGDWLGKLDLKDAYLTVPIFPAHQKYLRFCCRGKIYQFSCLAFGLNSAPHHFTKLLMVVVTFLRQRGMKLVVYLDDILILNENRAKLIEDLAMARWFLEFLCFLVNEKKSEFSPSLSIQYFGVNIDSTRLIFSLSI